MTRRWVKYGHGHAPLFKPRNDQIGNSDLNHTHPLPHPLDRCLAPTSKVEPHSSYRSTVFSVNILRLWTSSSNWRKPRNRSQIKKEKNSIDVLVNYIRLRMVCCGRYYRALAWRSSFNATWTIISQWQELYMRRAVVYNKRVESWYNESRCEVPRTTNDILRRPNYNPDMSTVPPV